MKYKEICLMLGQNKEDFNNRSESIEMFNRFKFWFNIIIEVDLCFDNDYYRF